MAFFRNDQSNVYNGSYMVAEKLRKKLIYFCWLLLFMLILFFVGAILYRKTSQINLTADLVIEIQGTDGYGEIVSISNQQNQADPIRNIYLSQIEYEAFPDSSLKNGQSVVVEAIDDMELSRKYQLYPVERKRTFIIDGLNDQDQIIQIVLSESSDKE